MTNDSGVVQIHGKEYATVPHRLALFHRHCVDNGVAGQIITTLERDDGDTIVMKAEIFIDSLLVATGFAEEVRGSSPINTTSALENCETSSVGRALGFASFASTESIASAEEVTIAIDKQQAPILLTKRQQRAIEKYIETRDNSQALLDKFLDRFKIDNLSELSKTDADRCLDKWGNHAN